MRLSSVLSPLTPDLPLKKNKIKSQWLNTYLEEGAGAWSAAEGLPNMCEGGSELSMHLCPFLT